ncbi:MAG: hypothetical protein PHP44_05430 [Kiritimatiellae bacterium]|nr:hypothetical protein [Kiritimatiellia bacterium]MDD4735529.1 hypothetical protein [Kiritimatiellia bacterium]
MRIWMKAAMILMLAGLISGCVKMDQTLTINDDGSASVEMSYGMSEAMVNQMEAMKKMSASMGEEEEEDDSFDFDEQSIRDRFAGLKEEGITLDSVSTEVKDGWKYINMKYSTKDLAALAKTDLAENSKMSLKKNADGNYVLLQKNSDYNMGDDSEETSPEMKEMMMKQMLPMMKGMQVAFRVKVPGEIIESNATEVQGKEVAWVYDVDKDPSFILNADKMEDMKVVFSGKGLSLEDIEITGSDED